MLALKGDLGAEKLAFEYLLEGIVWQTLPSAYNSQSKLVSKLKAQRWIKVEDKLGKTFVVIGDRGRIQTSKSGMYRFGHEVCKGGARSRLLQI